MAPVAVKDSASDVLRNGKIAAREPWLMSMIMCPSASRPSSRMSGLDRSTGTETGAGSATAAARESEAMAPMLHQRLYSEGVQAGDVAPDDQRVDVVGSLVGIHRLQ